jgi:hypothetical protein
MQSAREYYLSGVQDLSAEDIDERVISEMIDYGDYVRTQTVWDFCEFLETAENLKIPADLVNLFIRSKSGIF